MVSIAIAGAAGSGSPYSFNIGGIIARALLQKRPQALRILQRHDAATSTQLDELVKEGAELARVDFDKPGTLVEALTGIDVVISALNVQGLSRQPALARAAKAAGVKLFIPSEFGGDTVTLPDDCPPHLKVKQALHSELKRLDLPYTLIWNGGFAEQVPAFWCRPVKGELLITGDGNNQGSWTTSTDLAAFIAHIVTEHPLASLANSILLIESSRYSFNELAKHVQGGFKVVHEPAEEAEKRWKETHAIPDYWRHQWAIKGGLVAQTKEELSNDLFPGHKWTDVANLLQ